VALDNNSKEDSICTQGRSAGTPVSAAPKGVICAPGGRPLVAGHRVLLPGSACSPRWGIVSWWPL